MAEPMRSYGSKVSFFPASSKPYLRYNGLTHERLPLVPYRRRMRRHLGTTQKPTVQLTDGRWMSDTTPIIRYFEERFPESPILPENGVLRFVALLMEDYADE